MKITTKILKQIIAEEIEKLSETGFGRHMAGETDRAAMGWYETKISELAALMKELYSADPINFEGNIEQAKKQAMKRDMAQESKKRKNKRK